MQGDFLIVNYTATDERGNPTLCVYEPAQALVYLQRAMDRGEKVEIYEIGKLTVATN